MAKRKKTADPFVLDGSVALAWCFADEQDIYADAVVKQLPRASAVVPALWHLEMANAFLVAQRRGHVARQRTRPSGPPFSATCPFESTKKRCCGRGATR